MEVFLAGYPTHHMMRCVVSTGSDRFGHTAGLRRYDDLRTAAGDVGQVAICVVGSAVEPGRRCPGGVP